jgi:hypothetical protein
MTGSIRSGHCLTQLREAWLEAGSVGRVSTPTKIHHRNYVVIECRIMSHVRDLKHGTPATSEPGPATWVVQEVHTTIPRL